ncbi:MAG: D-alanine--D-alanine ligase [Bacteroidota bacterium]
MVTRRQRLNVGVVFGGVSPEHEVSIISALQAAAHLDRDRYVPVPIYIAKDGSWITGNELLLDPQRYTDLEAIRRMGVRVMINPGVFGQLELVEDATGGLFGTTPLRIRLDVLLLGLHGGDGENGGLQGLCDLLNVPYTGSGVFGSALGMDKVHSKLICRDQSIPIVPFEAFLESEWGGHEEAWLSHIGSFLGYPVIVKPARLGSSIGIAKADDRAALDAAIEEALRYDEKVVIEAAVPHLREVNCSVLGDVRDAQASVLEEPVRTDTASLLTFQEKYMRGGGAKGKGPAVRGTKHAAGAAGMASLDRIIPAPLSASKTEEIRELAVRIFQVFECSGVARIDFLMNSETEEVYFNEINTIPGSFSFYLWNPPELSEEHAYQRFAFKDLVQYLIDGALKRHRARNGRLRTYDVNLLSERSLRGLTGSKGG